jgi:uncharacterized protein YccT (UPF0319 family)
MLKQSLMVLLTCVSVHSIAAELTIDKPISAMALNGVKFDGSEVTLQPGTHQLVARYSYQLANSGNKKKRIQSEVKVFHIDVENEETISLIAPRYSRYSQAEYAFNNDNIVWSVQDQSGKEINYTVKFIPGRTGMLPYSDIERVVEDYNKSQNITVDEIAGILSTNLEPTNGELSTSTSMQATLESAKTEFLKLNEEDRKAFKRWLVDID